MFWFDSDYIINRRLQISSARLKVYNVGKKSLIQAKKKYYLYEKYLGVFLDSSQRRKILHKIGRFFYQLFSPVSILKIYIIQ